MPIRYLDEQPIEQPKSRIRYLDEETPVQNQARAGSPAEAFGLGIAGGQLPFGNVITSRLAAEATAPFLQQEGESWRDAASRLYDEAQAYTKATQEENPKATLAGNIAGAVSTIPAAFSKGGGGGLGGIRGAVTTGTEKAGEYAGKLANFSPFAEKGLGAAGNVATRYVGRTAVAAPVAGLYAAGDADAGKRGEAFKSGAAMGAVASAAIPAALAGVGLAAKGAKNIAKGITARAPEMLDDALMSMKDFSRGLYKQSEAAGAILTPQAAQQISQSVSNIVKNANTGASQTLYSKTLGAIQGLNDDLARGNTGLEVLDAHRQILGNLAKDITNPNRAQEAEAAGRAIDAIDNIIENLTPNDIQNQSRDAIESLLQARQVWSQSKKFEKISDIVKNSGGDANKLKRDLERFASNAKNTLGWNKEELDALKFAGQQTTGEGLLKMLGKFGFDIGSGRAVGNTGLPVIGGAIGGGAGLMTGGLSGAAIPAATVMGVGTAARQGQKYLARGKAELLLEALEKYGQNPQIAQQAQQSPNIAQKMAKALGVSRAGVMAQQTKDKLWSK